MVFSRQRNPFHCKMCSQIRTKSFIINAFHLETKSDLVHFKLCTERNNLFSSLKGFTGGMFVCMHKLHVKH